MISSRQSRSLTIAAAVLLAGAVTARAQEAASPPPSDRWELSATAYFWAAALDGDGALRGRGFDVDVPFSDVWESLSVGFMGTAVARKGDWGFYVSPFFVRIGDDAEVGGAKFRYRNDTTFLGVGGTYRLLDWQNPDTSHGGPKRAQLEALAGGRVVDLRLELNGRHRLPDNDESETWVDPVVGLHGRIELTDRWELLAEGDIGGFGVGSDISWSWLAAVGYRFEPLGHDTFLRAGYRMLHIDYEDGGFEWDVTYKGPMVGLTMRF
ncbi:MAG TPA: hypothetical protein PKA13_06065 [Geminicoccaceae bacterium]|nr:hypothetical protein [Geminicoccus sp.]HMU49320.1 hypothetical protein [Geminicoccaceae bacterium]